MLEKIKHTTHWSNNSVKKMDVVVIGAGINGSWTALHLAKQGYKVILLEQVKLQKSELIIDSL